jgi:hypothetical protein|tara:strand:+ start:666 stop:908 length:243 start_codon:yes stop_codon:yes gene_type:complete
MPETQRLLEQEDSIQESYNEKIRVAEGGRIVGVEGSMRADLFDHDVNSEYDFSEDDCPVCELPEHAQNEVIHDIEQEEDA